MKTTGHILCAGLSYCAQALLPHLSGWQVSATLRAAGPTARSAESADDRNGRAAQYKNKGIHPILASGDGFDVSGCSPVTHVLLSAPPNADGSDPILKSLGAWLAGQPLQWVGYLSTTGVYGDHQGAWVDEESAAGPLSQRGARRVAAEAAWRQWGEDANIAVHFFRLPGIYGPGRSAIETVHAGTARQIIKPDQVFSRIHVDDIAQTLWASMSHPNAGQCYNVCDDAPAPPQDIIQYAADLLSMPPPPAVHFEDADLSEMARSFYSENKRVRNDRIKNELHVVLKYPSYREGVLACYHAWQRRQG